MSAIIKPVKKAVFPVAGLGTRLLPATKAMPKEMLTIVDRPLIQMAVEEAREAGIEEFIFVLSAGKEALVQHFSDSEELLKTLTARKKTEQIEKINRVTLPQGSLKTARQDEALGLGHAVWCARDIVGDHPFAVLLPDDTVRNPVGCLAQMMQTYNKHGGNVIATCAVPKEETSRYGILSLGDAKNGALTITGLVEKPSPETAPSNMAIFGRYILQPEVFTHLAKGERGAGGEIQLTDAMAHLLAEQPFYGFEFTGERLDCGNEVGFIKAQIAYALDNPGLSAEILSYMKSKLESYRV
jgi:UTP--glucose-1-phosphate uridylyltransferase